ncbi:Aureobasidin resistance protein Aur1 [Quaeritorhiza haematococci]|nr:Aureobasidin resistance protein Aur1 [Quaeritorhiza haematococci]
MLAFFRGPKQGIPTFLIAFGSMNAAGVVTQLVFPNAPPWYNDLYGTAPASYSIPGDPGGLRRVDVLLSTGDLYSTAFKNSPLVFGAFPSLHSAFACIIGLFAFRWWWWSTGACGSATHLPTTQKAPHYTSLPTNKDDEDEQCGSRDLGCRPRPDNHTVVLRFPEQATIKSEPYDALNDEELDRGDMPYVITVTHEVPLKSVRTGTDAYNDYSVQAHEGDRSWSMETESKRTWNGSGRYNRALKAMAMGLRIRKWFMLFARQTKAALKKPVTSAKTFFAKLPLISKYVNAAQPAKTTPLKKSSRCLLLVGPALMLSYIAWMWFATLYFRHHYQVDLLGGAVYAGTAYWTTMTFTRSKLM